MVVQVNSEAIAPTLAVVCCEFEELNNIRGIATIAAVRAAYRAAATLVVLMAAKNWGKQHLIKMIIILPSVFF